MFRPRMPLCLAAAGLIAAVDLPAQEQEKGLTQRMNTQPDMSQVNPMQNQAYAAGAFGTKTFGSSEYSGVKSAPLKSFETRSFLGIKNPWFGRKVFTTDKSRLGERRASESADTFGTKDFAVRDFGRSRAASENDAILPSGAEPRPFLVAGKTQSGLDRFTENTKKELTIDEVRDLLNKGKSD